MCRSIHDSRSSRHLRPLSRNGSNNKKQLRWKKENVTNDDADYCCCHLFQPRKLPLNTLRRQRCVEIVLIMVGRNEGMDVAATLADAL